MAKVQNRQEQIIVSGNHQTTNGTQPTVTPSAATNESQASQQIPPQRNDAQQPPQATQPTEQSIAPPAVERRQPIIINSPREEQQPVRNIPTAEQQIQIPARTIRPEIHPQTDNRRVTRAMTNTQNA